MSESSELVGREAEELVELLAQIDVESCFDEPALLLAAMTERQAILTALQNTDTRHLSEERRAHLNERLQAVLVQNGELLIKAGERLEGVRKSMEKLSSGRATVRGYGDQRAHVEPGIKRVG